MINQSVNKTETLLKVFCNLYFIFQIVQNMIEPIQHTYKTIQPR